MPYTIEAKCPCCGKTASGLEEIEEIFLILLLVQQI